MTKQQLRAYCLCLLLGLFWFEGTYAAKVENLVLSSAVAGEMLDHGKPVEGLKIQRVISWNMEAGVRTEFTTTNAEGKFQFPEVRGTATFGYLEKLFHVPVILIDVDLLEAGSSTSLFSVVRTSYKPAAETGFNKIQLNCDLKDRQIFRERLPIIDCQIERTNNFSAAPATPLR